MRLLQINVSANVGSTGKIAEQIGVLAKNNGWDSYIAYGRSNNGSSLKSIHIGSHLDLCIHGLETRLFDRHGLASKHATSQLVSEIERIKPNIIHLHNIHGYYINYPILFKFLKSYGNPVVWTLHDCWPFTGHCAYFMLNNCQKWKKCCQDCPSYRFYPSSLFIDNSKKNYMLKKHYFSALGNLLTLVPVSDYVGNYIPYSFFKESRVKVIHNGIDIEVFRPLLPKEKIILGVANIWESRKGLNDFFELRKILGVEYKIILVGLSDKQIKNLPEGVIGIRKTKNQTELAKLYSSALAFVNPTYEDNYPTVNLESIACGTPVITYNTGGSPESLSYDTGIVIEKGDIMGIREAINKIENGNFSIEKCRDYAIRNFDQRICFQNYMTLYHNILKCNTL